MGPLLMIHEMVLWKGWWVDRAKLEFQQVSSSQTKRVPWTIRTTTTTKSLTLSLLIITKQNQMKL